MVQGRQRTAVILFNLGGPDALEFVRPFLLNLFSDPAILRMPSLMRWVLARFIVWWRLPVAQEVYRKLGGASPLLANTQAQARALEAELGGGVRCFVVMRYWHPFSDEVWEQVRAFGPEKVVFLPLYPQFSTTTTESSFDDMLDAAQGALEKPESDVLRTVCCYPVQPGFIAAQVDLLRPVLLEALGYAASVGAVAPRVLFSAHGLPEQVVLDGDPYQEQCVETAAAIVQALTARVNDRNLFADVDFVSCYQSKVGRMVWIGPSTEDEIRRAGAEKRPVVVVPVSFVSEHSETLVELDMEYADLAEACGVPYFGRVATVSLHPQFIQGLAALVRGALADDGGCAGGACSHGCARRHVQGDLSCCWRHGGSGGTG